MNKIFYSNSYLLLFSFHQDLITFWFIISCRYVIIYILGECMHSLCPLFYVLTFINHPFWLVWIQHTYHVIHFLKDWSLKFSKLRNLHWKIWMRENTDNQWRIWHLLKSYYPSIIHIILKNVPNRWIPLLTNNILLENFLNVSLDEKWPLMFILSIFFLTIAGYEMSKVLLWSIIVTNLSSPTIW